MVRHNSGASSRERGKKLGQWERVRISREEVEKLGQWEPMIYATI